MKEIGKLVLEIQMIANRRLCGISEKLTDYFLNQTKNV